MDFNPEDLAGKPIPPSLYRAVVPDRVLLSLNDTGMLIRYMSTSVVLYVLASLCIVSTVFCAFACRCEDCLV